MKRQLRNAKKFGEMFYLPLTTRIVHTHEKSNCHTCLNFVTRPAKKVKCFLKKVKKIFMIKIGTVK